MRRPFPRLLSVCAGLALAAAAGVVGTSQGADGAIVVPLRVHVMKSAVRDLNAAPVVTNSEIRDRVKRINQIFEPTGVSFRLERLADEHVRAPTEWREAIAGEVEKARAYGAIVDTSRMVAPGGIDLYVVRRLEELDAGGSFRCRVGDSRYGAAFISAESRSGTRMATRKWAHELGHALGVNHTPCEAKYRDNLMMSGRCSHAEPLRVVIRPEQRDRIRAQAKDGRAVRCGG